MPALPFRDYTNLRIDAESAVFLVDHGYASLITKLVVVEEKFKEVMKIVNMRSDLHVSKLQPELKRLGFVEGQPPPMTEEDFFRELGHPLVTELSRITQSIFDLGEDAIQSHEEIILEVKQVGSKIYPDSRITSFEYANDKKKDD